MITLSDLQKIVQKKKGKLQEDILLSLSYDHSVGAAIDALSDIFGKDNKQHIIRLRIKGKQVGYFKLTDLSAIIEPQTKGTGDFDPYSSFLPAGRVTGRGYRCPYCHETYRSIRDDAYEEIPKCKRHDADVNMIPE
jgi:hypothetical protein